jgi:hypothetical protein
MDDTFRLDLGEQDKEYIFEVLDAFLDDAHRDGRKLAEIRMRKGMLDRLELSPDTRSFRGVPITVCDTGFDGTIEVVLAPLR